MDTPRDYPSRLARIVVGVPAGGPLDIAARLIAPWLTERLGQAFAVENLTGDHSNLAARTVLGSAPDGHTLLLSGPVYPINNALHPDLDFVFARDFAPVAGLFRVPLIAEVNPSLPITTVPELIAHAKANPGRLRLAYAGVGTPQHIGVEHFKALTGVDFEMVPYAGSAAALADMLAGRADVMFDPMSSSAELARTGQLRPLAVTSPVPSAALPGVPAMCAFVAGYEAGSWFGINAPLGTAPGIIDKLNRAINAGLADAKIRARVEGLGGIHLSGSPADFGRLIALEAARYRDVIRAANITAR
jgi:tripartite-type tricarboxylate transporter receptor subunit TctC